MTAYNWAVVGVHVEDAKLTPVELFEEYEDGGEDAAPIFMLFNLPKGEPATRGHLRLLDAIGCNCMKRDC